MALCGSVDRMVSNNSGSSLSIVYRDIESLHCDSQNPRRHSRQQIKQIAQSIEAFGFNVPFLIDRKLQLIAGHGRLAACKLLGIRRVPTISLEHLTSTQIRAFQIADNKLVETSSWDDRLLAKQLKFLAAAELDFTLEATGFEMGEIELMIEGASPPSSTQNEDYVVPAMTSPTRIAKLGDVWLLDRHRLFCGDASKDHSYAVLMNGNQAAATFVDPPCTTIVEDYTAGDDTVRLPDSAIGCSPKKEAELTGVLAQIFRQLVCNSRGGALHFVCANWRRWNALQAAGEQQYTALTNVCVWVKDRGKQNSPYRDQYELVFVFTSGNTADGTDVRYEGCRQRSNVWQYPAVTGKRKHNGTAGMLPTQKPVALVADAIMDSTSFGEIVLDPFLGTGTTLIAAERTGRIGYGIELDPVAVDCAIQRWQQFTQHHAIHAGSGRSFAEIAEVRHGE